jgi:PAS domain S-box-containing protein
MKSSNEELKASNGEIMSVNEELQTSKEELKSLKEEFSTVKSQLEQKVRELEATSDDLDNLLSSTDLPTLLLDSELRIKYFTAATGGLFNLIATDRGRPLADISRKIEDPDLLTDAGRVLERRVPAEKDVATADSTRRYTRRVLPCRTRDDRIQGVVVTFRDVTERKHGVEWFRRIIDALPNAVVVVNKDGEIEFINSRTEQFFGYTRKELVGMPVELLIPERLRDRHPGYRSSYFANPQPRSMGDGRELLGRRKDGSEFPVEIGLSPLETQWGTCVLATIIDITGRRRAARELSDARDQSMQANRVKSAFLARLSHDLRQPLQALTLLNAVLTRRIQDPDLREAVRKQDIAFSSVRQLIHLFMEFSQIETGAVKPQITDFPMDDVLEAIKTEYGPLAAARNLSLHIVPCSVSVHSDDNLLRRILQSFVASAIKYTERGRVLVGCRRRGEALRVEVWDTDPGIPAEHPGDIFDESVQPDKPARQAATNHDVGLFVTRQLAQLLGHRLDVRPAPGKGSMFAVEVPVTTPTETIAQSPADTPSVPYQGKAGAGVLVIEDDPDVLAAMRALLEGLGLTVTAVSSGVEALARLKAGGEPFDLIIADYRLAEAGSGVDTVRHLLDALERKIPLLLLSGDVLPASVSDMEAGGYRVLQKPIEVDQLVAEMNRLFGV